MADSPSLQTACANCQEPATKACSGCKETPALGGNPVEKTSYCSTECQKKDWVNHKKLCKRLQMRKAIYRAGDTLQQVFYVYRERFFDKLIVMVEHKNGKLYVYEGGAEHAIMNKAADCVVPFPANMLRSTEDKQAVLVHMACSDAVGWMHDLIKHVLKGIASEVGELSVTPKNHKREVVGINSDGEEDPVKYKHEILNIKMKHGLESYVLDLTGAQFGYYEPVVSLLDYYDSRIQNFILGDLFGPAFGGVKADLEKDCAVKHPPGSYAAGTVTVKQFHRQTSKALDLFAIKWEKEKGMAVEAMLKLPQQAFETRQQEFIGFIDQGLEGLLARIRQSSTRGLAKSLEELSRLVFE